MVGCLICFMQNKEVTVALRENICFYANYSGISRIIWLNFENTSQRGNKWLPYSFLDSSCCQPTALLCLLIIVGPCMSNAKAKVKTRYIHSCLWAIKLMVIKSQYEQVPNTESRSDLTQGYNSTGHMVANVISMANFMFKSLTSLSLTEL